MAERKKKFAKYPMIGRLTIGDLCRVARKHGMEVISAVKCGMEVYYQIGLWGTASQARAVEAEWASFECGPLPRSFKSHSKVNVEVPRERWLSVPVGHRPYCTEQMSRGHLCSCDFGLDLIGPARYQEEPTNA